jgi:hypothetical protein
MSAEKPTTPKERTAAASPVEEDWDELEGRTGATAIEDEKPTPSQIEPEGNEEDRRKRVLSRRVRLVVAGALAVLAVALASIVFAALVGRDSVPRPQPQSGTVHAKRQGADGRRSSRARWLKEADGRRRSRQGRAAPGAPRAGRHIDSRRRTGHPVQQPPQAPTQSPESGATSPEPSVPAPDAPSEPKEEPGLRDGATESSEFGL